jgi:transposase
MRHADVRKLPPAAQEERRRQGVGLRQRGLTCRVSAEQVGRSRTGVIDICQRCAAEGRRA